MINAGGVLLNLLRKNKRRGRLIEDIREKQDNIEKSQGSVQGCGVGVVPF